MALTRAANSVGIRFSKSAAVRSHLVLLTKSRSIGTVAEIVLALRLAPDRDDVDGTGPSCHAGKVAASSLVPRVPVVSTPSTGSSEPFLLPVVEKSGIP